MPDSLSRIDKRIKRKLEILVQNLNIKYNLQIKSVGLTSYIFDQDSRFFKMNSLSYETEEFKKINTSFIKQNNSIITIKDFLNINSNNLLIDKKNHSFSDKYTNNDYLYYYKSLSFEYDLKELDVESIKSSSEVNIKIIEHDYNSRFIKWNDFINNSIRRNFYSLKKTWHHPINKILTLGVTLFLISDGQSSFKSKKRLFEVSLDDFFNSLNYEYLSIAFIAYSNDLELKRLEIQKKSLKSSLAAVMSRNMSHNIGSHVLNKLSSKENTEHFFKLSNKNKLFLQYKEDNILQSNPYITPGGIYQISKYFENIEENAKTSELARVFNDYLKKRMDFVADVATSDRATILNSKYLFSDVFKNFERNLLLIHNISGKEEKFKFKFDFCIVDKDGNKKEFYDPIIAMPNDILGSQAFYIILENIIRNTAKHSGVQFNDNYKEVTFTIKIDDDTFNDFYRVSIYDNISWEKQGKTRKKAIDDYKEFIEERNQSIASRILEDNQIRKNGWGTIELKIAACYLSRVATSNIESYKYSPFSKKNKYIYREEEIDNWRDVDSKYRVNKKTNKKAIPLLQAIDGSKDETSGFGYQFLMKKPKEILILDNLNLLENEFNNGKNINFRKVLNKCGVSVLNHINEQESYNHNILVVLTDNDVNFKNNLYLPQRQIVINSENKCTFFDGKKLESPIEVLDIKNSIKTIIKDKSYTELANIYWATSEILYRTNTVSVSKPNGCDYSILKNVNNNKNKIRFDHHGESKIYKEFQYYEPFGSSSIFNMFLISNCDKFKQIIDENSSVLDKMFGPDLEEKENEILSKYRLEPKNMLIQAANTKVLIIDERIQSSLSSIGFTAQNNGITGKSYTFEELFDLTNIKVPKLIGNEFTIDLNSTNLNLVRKELLEYIKDQSDKNDFVVIHFGILETMRDSDNNLNSIVTSIKEFFGLSLSSKDINSKAKLIITSGRGFTPDIKELKLPFVSYSALSNYLIDPNNRSKLHLTELLKSIRL